MANKTSISAPTPDDHDQSVSNTGRRGRQRSHALQILYGEQPIIHKGGPIWEVPSETRSAYYAVNLERLTCDCPFWRKHRRLCKHIDDLRIYRSQSSEPRGTKSDVVFTNPPYYDRLAKSSFDLVSLLLQSLTPIIDQEVTQMPKGVTKK